MKTNLNDLNNVDKEVSQKKPAKKDFFFYQGKYLRILNLCIYVSF